MVKLPKSLIRVTAFSKLIALFVIVGFLVSAFYAGYLFSQKYGSALSEITPTPTPISNEQTSCSVDSDCILTSADTKNSCCPNLKCLDYADSSTVAVNGMWAKEEKTSVCGVHIMCPMIATMCPRQISEENQHYQAKCVEHVCTKVRN